MKHAVLIALGLAVGTAAAMAQTGNGAPSGGHYNLNILGKKDCTPADLTGSNRHTIQVLLNGGDSAGAINGTSPVTLNKQNKIFLQGGMISRCLMAMRVTALSSNCRLIAAIRSMRARSANPAVMPT